MHRNEFIQAIKQALSKEITFRDWIEQCYNNWARENADGLFHLPYFANYLEVDFDCVIDWISTDRRLPSDQKNIEKLWNKYGFVYCFVADTPPPGSLFPEGLSSKKIRMSFERLKVIVISGDLSIEGLRDTDGFLKWMSSDL